MMIKRSIRYFFQRLFRGWDDSETWNLDYTIALFIHPRLVRFKEINIAFPPNLTSMEWDDILDKMIKAFELIIDEDKDYTEENNKIIEDGLNLFRTYYFDLWW